MSAASARNIVVLAVLLSTAGCLDVGPSETISPTTMEDSPGWSITAGDQPDANKAVHLENLWNETVTMELRVVRQRTGTTVHDATYEIGPGEEITAYNLSDSDPEGIESFSIVVAARNQSANVTIETNACYGDAYGEIQDDGELYLYYAIC